MMRSLSLLRGTARLHTRLFFSRFSSSSSSSTIASEAKKQSKVTSFDGFNQFLRIGFKTAPNTQDSFTKISNAFLKESYSLEKPHLMKFNILQEQQRPDNFLFYQIYGTREGFMNHRTSVHFSEFMQAAGQCLADDVFLDEYKTLYPQKDEWHTHFTVDEGLEFTMIEVSFSVIESRVEEFIALTHKHCLDLVWFSLETSHESPDFGRPPPLRVYFIQQTKKTNEFKLLLLCPKERTDLTWLKESSTYCDWSKSISEMLEEPRSSKRYDKIK